MATHTKTNTGNSAGGDSAAGSGTSNGDKVGGGGGGGGGGRRGTDAGTAMKELKSGMLAWINKIADNKTFGDEAAPVKDLKKTFADGTIWLKILHRVDPDGSPYAPSDNAVENVKDAFEDAEKKYGVPMLIDPDDPNYWKDEKVMIPQLATWMDSLPDIDVIDAEAAAEEAEAQASEAAAQAEEMAAEVARLAAEEEAKLVAEEAARALEAEQAAEAAQQEKRRIAEEEARNAAEALDAEKRFAEEKARQQAEEARIKAEAEAEAKR